MYTHFMQDAGSLTCNGVAGNKKDVMVAGRAQVQSAIGISHQTLYITKDGSPTRLAEREKVWNVTCNGMTGNR